MVYQVKLDAFEGPFDLLINLISRQKIDVYEIPIAKITDEYLGYVNSRREFDLEVSTEFLLVAATLLDIKAARLLPREEDLYDEDELDPYEAREILIARQIEYKKFKNVSSELATRYEAESKHRVRDVGLEEKFANLIPDFLAGVSLDALRKLFLTINEKKVIDLVQADHITPKPLSIVEYVTKVKERLSGVKARSFRELTYDCDDKIELITIFLAVLELYKRGVVELGQAETFGEIMIIVVDNTEVMV
ncbi:MAG: segregation/condensation protein A [Actinobacteria bacterium]|nr:segregation/condensation protein A [Actinomycetota bacterium]